jgi:pimeloyl-ACP methyl ester carboxylesterase
MPTIRCNNLEFEYERIGKRDDPAILLIAGLGFQLIDWPLPMCQKMAQAGYQVLRFDNRDIGLSQKLTEAALSPPSYQLDDMAKDVSELLRALTVEKAHIVGMSMGGMIAQLVAANYPDQTISLTSIMSSTSDPSLPGPNADAAAVLASAPQTQDIAQIVAFGLKVNDVVGSPKFRWSKTALQAHIENCIDRSYSPDGYMRQYAAVLAAKSRREALRTISAPSLVIHGSDDPLVQPVCGRDVAEHLENSRYIEIDGMGHDLSPSLCDHLADLILDHVSQSRP